jgi:hypothetical protein
MKKTLLVAIGVITMLSLGLISAQGQATTPAPERAEIERSLERSLPPNQLFTTQGPDAKAQTFFFVESEFSFDGKLVKGSPYSAEAVTETTQVLSDGNRIVRKTSSMLYRDSEGRTRREQSLTLPDQSGQTIKTVMINDPVAGVSYSLDPDNHTGRKSSIFRFERSTPAPSGGGNAPRAAAVTVNSGGYIITSTGPGGANSENRTLNFRLESDERTVVRESLGTQNIEGVDAEGTRMTRTIPAGAIGNERPIQIVEEHWYSPVLQTFVMTRNADPRTGETIYRLTNIDRSEPAHSLFEVPVDYQIKEQSFGVGPARTRRPE